MKKLVVLTSAVLLFSLLSGCMMGLMTPGWLYTGYSLPYPSASVALEPGSYSKVGSGAATNILGIIATGDASIEAGMRAGGISKVHHVDYKATSILGIFSSITVYVYGD